MKPAKAVTEARVRVEYTVEFSRGPNGRRVLDVPKCPTPPSPSAPLPLPPPRPEHRASPKPALLARALRATASDAVVQKKPYTARDGPARVPKITLLLVLGHHFERLVRDGVVKDYAEIALRMGLTRARVTQIVNLTLLAPEIQLRILGHAGGAGSNTIHERQLRLATADPNWRCQLAKLEDYDVSEGITISRR